VAELDALASGVRLAVVEHLERTGGASVRELAAALGRAPSSLYHHLARLTAVGLVVERERRPAGRRLEAVYALASNRIRLTSPRMGAPERGALGRMTQTLLRRLAAAHARALSDPGTRLSGPGRQAMVRMLALRLDPEGLRQLNEALDAFVGRWSETHTERGTHAVRVALVLAPAAAERAPRAAGSARQPTRRSRPSRRRR
jgi:DNA-binding transcriptional ArsR family regulator